jgi:hypothetical protein
MSVEDLRAGLSQSLSQYLIPGLPGPTLKRVIEMTLDKERYAGDFAPIVMDNSAYAQFVLKVDFLQTRVKEWIAEVPEGQVNNRVILERIFILLGKQASRNLIASIRLARIGNQLPRKKNERFSPNPKEQLKQALLCEEFCEAHNYAGSDLAFLGGLQFDLLGTNLVRLKASREVQNILPTAFSDALKTAHFAYEIGARMGSFPHSEYAFPAVMSLGLGKILATALYPKEGTPSYAGFLAEVEKKTTYKWEWAASEERLRFPLRPVELSAIAALNFGFLRRVEPAIRFSDEAYFLKKTQPKLYPLALLVGLADAAASGRPPTASMLDGLKGMRVNSSILAEAAKAVSGKGKT